MIKQKLAFKGGGWLKTNIKYAIIGTLVGLLMSFFILVFNPNGIAPTNVMLNVLFSLFITLSIANIIRFVQCYFNPAGNNFWKFVSIFYLCNLVGLAIGTELSYLIVSFIFNTPYEFAYHEDDYKLSGVITLVIGTLILLYYFQQVAAETALQAKEVDLIKLNQLKTQAELQALQAKINPHFLYNSLNSIVSLIHEDANKAEDMTLKLSKLFRYSINTMEENYSTIRAELEILDAYLAIEKVRFGDRINFEIAVANDLLELKIPRFLLQPLVENALKHGLKDVLDNGTLGVSITKMEKQLVILICDNGIPFPEELVAGYGLQSTFDKLKLLYKHDQDLEMSNQPEKHIKITIPLTS